MSVCSWDVVEKLPKLALPSDYYALLLFHVGVNDTTRSDVEVSD